MKAHSGFTDKLAKACQRERGLELRLELQGPTGCLRGPCRELLGWSSYSVGSSRTCFVLGTSSSSESSEGVYLLVLEEPGPVGEGGAAA